MGNSAILLAAGSGSRMQGVVQDKLLAKIKGKEVFAYSIETLSKSGKIDTVVVVYRDHAQKKQLNSIFEKLDTVPFTIHWTPGGKERQDSVFKGLKELSLLTEIVLIHDCARPLMTQAHIDALIHAATRDKAAVLAHRVTDTIKQTPAKMRGKRRAELKDLNRQRLWAMETPQAFKYDTIYEAYREVRLNQLTITDDTAAVSVKGIQVTLIENKTPNPKITLPHDLRYIEFLLDNPLELESA